MLDNQSLAVKFGLLFMVTVLLLGGAYYQVIQHIYQVQLNSQARVVADNVEAYGHWVSKFGGVFTRNSEGSYLSKGVYQKLAEAGEAEEEPITLYAKNPALAIREYAESVSHSDSPAQFRMVSGNYMNPANSPDAFESEALTAVIASGAKEYSEIIGNQYRYARTVVHKKGCIGCHGAAEDAPDNVISRYGTENGFGFTEGDVAGVISVSIPARSVWDMARETVGVTELLLAVMAFLFSFLFLRREVIQPIGWITDVTERLSRGEHYPMELPEGAEDSNNEMLKLSASVCRLQGSLDVATDGLRRAHEQHEVQADQSEEELDKVRATG